MTLNDEVRAMICAGFGISLLLFQALRSAFTTQINAAILSFGLFNPFHFLIQYIFLNPEVSDDLRDTLLWIICQSFTLGIYPGVYQLTKNLWSFPIYILTFWMGVGCMVPIMITMNYPIFAFPLMLIGILSFSGYMSYFWCSEPTEPLAADAPPPYDV